MAKIFHRPIQLEGSDDYCLDCGRKNSNSRAFFVISVLRPITTSALVFCPSNTSLGNSSPAEKLDHNCKSLQI